MMPKSVVVNLFLAGVGIFSFVGFGVLYQAYPERVGALFSLPEKPRFSALNLNDLWPTFPKIGPKPSFEGAVTRETTPSPPVEAVAAPSPTPRPAPPAAEERVSPSPTTAPAESPAAGLVKLPKEIKTEIKISDKDVNQYLSQIPTEALPLAEPKVAFSQGKVTLSGRLAGPIEGEIEAEVEVFLVNEKQVGVKIKKATINGFPLPVFLLPQLETPFNDLIAGQLGEFVDYKIESLVVEDGLLTLGGAFFLR